ncbi:hypothetical protein PR002_g32757 [Phytophthora rubi]|uniref:RxLR effector protein n=1 Tax=Phytophthora rubi TaxID=129364 RepID=A0A6A3G125_9STRA|nr:hypothetical protein PR002_g32757 [Phytophthora rubi]
MRFICGCLLIAVPCFACHQPRDQQQQQQRRQQQQQHCRGRGKLRDQQQQQQRRQQQQHCRAPRPAVAAAPAAAALPGSMKPRDQQQ